MRCDEQMVKTQSPGQVRARRLDAIYSNVDPNHETVIETTQIPLRKSNELRGYQGNMNMVKLPTEVHLLIIEELGEDKKSLSSCSLVCRSWLAVSRRCLFRVIQVSSTKDGSRAGRFDLFLQVLENSSSLTDNAGKYVRKLIVKGEVPEVSDDPLEDEEATYVLWVPLPLDTLARIISSMPHLQHLTLERLLFFRCHQPNQGLDALTLRALEVLNIYHCSSTTRDISHLLDVVCMFSEVKQWIVDSGPWELLPDSQLVRSRQSLPLIHSVDFDSGYESCAAQIHDLLRISGSLNGPLTKIVFHSEQEEDAAPFFVFLPEAALNLVKLDLQIFATAADHPETSAVAFPLRFPPLPALTSLTLGLDCDEEMEEEERCQRVRNAVAAYTQLLSPHQSLPSLEAVRVTVLDPVCAPQTFSCQAYKNALWSDFARVLARFPQIRAVDFILLGLSREGSVAEEETCEELHAFVEQYMVDEEYPERSLDLYYITSTP
ncbi:hypothetical protein C8Q76DRAFT_804399 [Earliella scabrosa]|nr:hypothetical protein C8Q76DRAFT_804399 [Earliella scabrosa]